MKCVVTGATGFLGTNLIEDLAEEGGIKIIATDIPKADFSEIKKFCHKIIPLDLSSDSLEELFQDEPDIVIHTAGVFDLSAPPYILKRVNVDAVERICRASLGKVKLFIHISSTGIYGKPEKIPADENTKPKPRNMYEKTKKEGEDIVKLYMQKGLNSIILRPTLMYGPRSKYGYAMLIGLYAIAKERKKEELPSVKGGPMTHSVYVKDVTEAIKFFIKRENGTTRKRIFNIADPTPLPFEKMLSTIASAVGVIKPLIPYFVARPLTLLISHLPIYPDLQKKVLNIWDEIVREKNLSSPLRPKLDREWNDYFAGDFMYSIEKIKSEGFSPSFTFEKGIEITVKWYRDMKWIP